MISPAIYTLLSGVGSIYPVRATQTTKWPYIVFNILSMETIGTKARPSVIDRYRVQFNIFSEQYADLNTKDDAIRDILDGYAGTVGTIKFDSIRLEARYDNFDNGAEYYSRTIEYIARVKP